MSVVGHCRSRTKGNVEGKISYAPTFALKRFQLTNSHGSPKFAALLTDYNMNMNDGFRLKTHTGAEYS